MNYIKSFFINHSLDFTFLQTSKREFIYSFLLSVFFIFIYKTFSLYIKKQNLSSERKYTALINFRNSILFIYVLLLLFIWIGEIKTSILSATALFSAFIITFKEVLLSIIGTLISNQNLDIGDYVEYDNVKGKIVNKTFLNTTILINDTKQIQELVVPNLVFLTSKFKKLSKIPKAHFATINLSTEHLDLIHDFSPLLKQQAELIVKEHNPEYSLYLKSIGEITPHFDAPEELVSITYDLSDPKRYQIIINFISRASKITIITHQIQEKFIEFVANNQKYQVKEK